MDEIRTFKNLIGQLREVKHPSSANGRELPKGMCLLVLEIVEETIPTASFYRSGYEPFEKAEVYKCLTPLGIINFRPDWIHKATENCHVNKTFRDLLK